MTPNKVWLYSILAVASVIAIGGGITIGYFSSPKAESAPDLEKPQQELDRTNSLDLQLEDTEEISPPTTEKTAPTTQSPTPGKETFKFLTVR